MDDIKLFSKNKKELKNLIHADRIYRQDIGMQFGIVMKSGKRPMTDGMELPNQDKIRTLGENETYKYLGILEADTIKQVQMKKNISGELEKYSRQNYVAEILSKEKILGLYSSLDIVDQRLT